MKKQPNREYLYGLHPVLESLKANRRKFYQLYLGQKIKNSTKEKEIFLSKKIPESLFLSKDAYRKILLHKFLPNKAIFLQLRIHPCH